MPRSDELEASIAMFRTCWRDALLLKEARDAWSLLAPATAGYHNFGPMLFGWYRDHVLAGCRRLLDDRRDSESLVRALRLLARCASEVTLDLVSEADSGHPFEDRFRRDRQRRLAKVVSGREDDETVDRLTKSGVDREIERLREDHKKVTVLASRVVAHRSIQDVEEDVSFDDVDALLDDVLDAAQRWVGLLDAVHLSLKPPGITGVRTAARALELFDWKGYVSARAEAGRELGPSAGPAEYEALEATARLSYEFGDP